MVPTKKKATTKMPAKKSTTKTKSYLALENVQRSDTKNLRFFLFHASASEIFQWSLIDRTSPEKPKAIQRRLNKTKVLRIKEFLEQQGNTIATSVVIVFNDSQVSFVEQKFPGSEDSRFGALSVSWDPNSPAGIIVDGQHRVIGANSFQHEDIHLNVVGILGADDDEGAFQFLVINNNSSKVNSNQVKALFTSYKEEDLVSRMLASGSTNIDSDKITALRIFDESPDSPFNGQLKWQKNAVGFIAPNALEAGLSEVQNRSALLAVIDYELDTFLGIWAVIHAHWTALWHVETHLLEKACFQVVTAYICDSLEQFLTFSDDGVDYTDPEVLAKGVKRILKRIEPNFFEVQWARTGLDTRTGQELLMMDLKTMASNIKGGRPWHKGLETVNVGAVSGDQIKKGDRAKKVKN